MFFLLPTFAVVAETTAVTGGVIASAGTIEATVASGTATIGGLAGTVAAGAATTIGIEAAATTLDTIAAGSTKFHAEKRQRQAFSIWI